MFIILLIVLFLFLSSPFLFVVGDDRVTCHTGQTIGDFSLRFIFMHFVINFMMFFLYYGHVIKTE